MPDTQFYTRQGAIAKATATKTTLALAKLRLTKDPFTPTQFSTKDELEAGEADFDGYTAGGYTLTAWAGPQNNLGGGAAITSPLVNIFWGPAGDPPVTNVITGWWIETAAGAVWLAGTFDPNVTMGSVTDAINFIRQIVEGLNVTIA